jgi:hypothetical protein
MQKLATVVIIGIFAIAAYLFWSSSAKPPAEPTAEVDSVTEQAARKHIETLTTESARHTIDIDQADNFVTGEQLLSLPETQGETAGVTSVEGGTAIAGDTSTPTTSDQPALPDLNRVRLEELLNNPEANPGDVFYIHAVAPLDEQGLWGIMQRGLTETFAKGIRVGEAERLLTTEIPQDADERLADRSSSFLGQLLDRKVQETLVYNYRQGLLGQNPDLIQPGQQLLIVRFSEAELISIYNHFARNSSP